LNPTRKNRTTILPNGSWVPRPPEFPAPADPGQGVLRSVRDRLRHLAVGVTVC
jgi:hypothetical protein